MVLELLGGLPQTDRQAQTQHLTVMYVVPLEEMVELPRLLGELEEPEQQRRLQSVTLSIVGGQGVMDTDSVLEVVLILVEEVVAPQERVQTEIV